MVSIPAQRTNDGRTIWYGTNKLRVSGLAGSVTRRLLRGKAGSGLGNINTVSGLIKVLEKKMRYVGYQQTQFWMLEKGFTVREIKELLVYMPDTGRITTRGSLDDVLAFEFFGVPQGTKPNKRRMVAWTKHVIQRDPKLKAEWEAKPKGRGRGSRYKMERRLAYSFSLAIEKKGLSRNYITGELDPANPDKIHVYWQGRRSTVKRHKPNPMKYKNMAHQLGIQEIFNHYTQRMHRGTRRYGRGIR